MQGAVDLVAGHGGAKGHFGGVFIADLAHQNNVRVLAHHGADAVGEVQFGSFVDRALANHGHGVFHRVFERHDVDGFVDEVVEHGVEGGGLAAAGGAGDQDDAFGPGHHQFDGGQGVVGEFQVSQGHDAFFPVQHPQYDVFAVGDRLGGDAKVHRAAGQRQ